MEPEQRLESFWTSASGRLSKEGADDAWCL
jgi:hypothetical protein